MNALRQFWGWLVWQLGPKTQPDIPIPSPITEPKPAEPRVLITGKQLAEIALYAKAAAFDEFVAPLNETLVRYKVDTRLRIAHFISQIMHESGEFRYLEEIASGAAYEGRRDLGNVQSGDGRRFKGRGLIQLTGRSNYLDYSLSKNGLQDFIAQPEQVAMLPWAVDVAGWYWNAKKLNEKADRDDVLAVTRAINGGTIGLTERSKYLARARLALA